MMKENSPTNFGLSKSAAPQLYSPESGGVDFAHRYTELQRRACLRHRPQAHVLAFFEKMLACAIVTLLSPPGQAKIFENSIRWAEAEQKSDSIKAIFLEGREMGRKGKSRTRRMKQHQPASARGRGKGSPSWASSSGGACTAQWRAPPGRVWVWGWCTAWADLPRSQ